MTRQSIENTGDAEDVVTSGYSPDAIYERLKHDISVGNIAQGAALIETQLAKRYDVSRTPIRQALMALEQDGLVSRNGRSLRVRSQTATEIMELYEVRELLEDRAAALAARKRDDVDMAVLRRLLERMSSPELDKGERYTLNREFHTAMWKAAHHAILLRTLERLYVNSVLGLTTTLAASERWATTLEEHRAMVEAIAEGDDRQAVELVRSHLQTARDIRLTECIDREGSL